jgi:hypothetical protein
MVRKASVWKLSLMGLLAGVLVAGVALTHASKKKGKLEAFEKELKEMGFIVQEGQVSFPDVLTMGCQCQLPSCYANNASSKYGLFALPPAPNQDPAVKNPYSEWFYEDNNLRKAGAIGGGCGPMRPWSSWGPPPPRWIIMGSRPTSMTAMSPISARDLLANVVRPDRVMRAERENSRLPPSIGSPSSPASGTR